MVTLLVLLLLAAPIPSHATPCRPTGADVGNRLPNGNYLLTYPASDRPRTDGATVHISSQSEKDCIEQYALMYIAQLAAVAGDLMPNGMTKIITGLGTAFTRIRVVMPYEGALQAPGGGLWISNPAGRDYAAEQSGMQAARADLTNAKVRAKAAARLAPFPDLVDLMDVNAAFEVGSHASYHYPPDMDPPRKWPPLDTKRAAAFPVDTRKLVKPCGNGDCALLDSVHAAHACGTPSHCGIVPPAPCPSTKAAMLGYEQGCAGDELCENFRRMKPFFIPEDTKHYDREQLCQIGLLQHVMMMRWADCQRTGNWKCSRLNDTRHQELHVMMGVGDPRALWVFPDDGPAAKYAYSFGGRQNIQTLLPKLVDYYKIELPAGMPAPTTTTTLPGNTN